MSDYSLGTARGVIRLEFQDAGTQQAQQAVEGLASTGQSAASKVMSALTGAAAVVSATVVGTTAAMATSVIKTGVAYNTLEQTSRAAFKTILGSAEAAETMMAKIKEFGQTSPFPRQAFIQATQQMLGFGYAADDVIPILKTINDATAALGGNADTIATFSSIFSKIKSNAKISGEEIARLGDIGVDAVSMLADAAGVTGEEIRKRISEGSIGAEEAITALTEGMNEKFGGAAANVKETWAGAVDRIKGAWRDLSSAIMEPLVSKGGGGGLTDLANSIADALRAVIPLAEKVMDAIGPKLANAIDPFTKKLSGLKDLNIDKTFQSVKKAVDDFGGSIALVVGGILGLSGTALAAIPGIGPLFSFLTGPVGLAAGAIAAMFIESEKLRDAFKMLIDNGGRLAEALGPVIEAFAQVFQTVAELAGDVLADLIVALLPALVTILEVLSPILQIIATLFDALAPILLPLIETAIMPLLTVLEILTPLLELLGEGLQWVADKLKEWAGSSEGDIEAVGQKMSEFLTDGLDGFNEFVTWVQENWPLIQQTISDVIEGIKTAWQGLVDFFAPIVNTIIAGWNLLQSGIQAFLDWWNTYPGPLIQAVVDLVVAVFTLLWDTAKTVWDGIMTAVGKVVTWFNTHVGPVIQAVIELIAAIMNYVWGVISSVWSSIKDKIDTVVTAVKSAIEKGWSLLVGIVKKIFDPVYNAIKDPLDKALDFVSGIKDKIVGFFRGAGSWLLDAGKKIIGGLIQGLEDMLGSLTSKLNFITDLIPKNKGPIEKDRKLLRPAGESIMEGLIAGILSERPNLVAALGGITASVPLAVAAHGSGDGSAAGILDRMYATEGATSTRGGDTYTFGDILISLEDLESIKTIEDFLDMIRVYKKQRGV